MTWQCKNADFICAFDDFVDLSTVVFYIAISNIKKRWSTIDFDEFWSSIKEKPRCAGKTSALNFRLIGLVHLVEIRQSHVGFRPTLGLVSSGQTKGVLVFVGSPSR